MYNDFDLIEQLYFVIADKAYHGLVPLGNKPLTDILRTQFSVATCRH